MRPMNFIQKIEVLGLELEARGIYYPGDSGKLSGPPEKCYPPEPAEVDVHTLTYQDEQQNYNMMPLFQSDIGDEILCRIEDAINEWLCNER